MSYRQVMQILGNPQGSARQGGGYAPFQADAVSKREMIDPRRYEYNAWRNDQMNAFVEQNAAAGVGDYRWNAAWADLFNRLGAAAPVGGSTDPWAPPEGWNWSYNNYTYTPKPRG